MKTDEMTWVEYGDLSGNPEEPVEMKCEACWIIYPAREDDDCCPLCGERLT